jgi:hypothetical protein
MVFSTNGAGTTGCWLTKKEKKPNFIFHAKVTQVHHAVT